ncbi:MAG: low molecular weight phosphotyrosine protein phosphatase [Chlorobiaceae bacterium]|jgi:protein-tyrosine phosphatase|nr:low molecular weight phosphotyrosine protein phosphatase [Chlorobiaceae bacterium]
MFICYENICRSPMAEGIFTDLLQRCGLLEQFRVCSAGTVSYQEGSAPDERAIASAFRLGVDISSLCASGLDDEEIQLCDWIFVMDHENHRDVSRLLGQENIDRLYMVMDFVDGRAGQEISDPYYGSPDDFDRVARDLVMASEQILLRMFDYYPDLALQAAAFETFQRQERSGD